MAVFRNDSTDMLHPDSLQVTRGNNIGEIFERQHKEGVASRRELVEWDAEKNYVYVVRGKIALQAIEDKILILLDKFKTGFECTTCGGTGQLETCPACSGKGLNRFGDDCKTCGGTPGSFKDKDCYACKGVGTTIIIPESAKAIPTSGIIVSIGPNCTTRKIGDRVLFGAHTGYMLPFKGNVKLRIMREHEPLCSIYMLDTENGEAALGDFMQIDEQV